MRYQEQRNTVAPAGMSYGVRTLVSPMEYAECAPDLPGGDAALRMAINADPKWFDPTSSPVASGPNWGDCALGDQSDGQGNYWHRGGASGCTPGNSLSGRPSIDFDGVGYLRYPSTNPTTNDVNLEAFSLVCVYGANQPKTNVLFSIGGGNYGRMLYTGSNGIFTLAGVTSTSGGGSLSDVDPVWVDASTKLAILTFSTKLGVAIRRNGVQRIADATRVLPPKPTANRLFIGGFDSIDPSQILNGAMANIRVFNFDLSAPENAAALKAVEDSAIAGFGITRGA